MRARSGFRTISRITSYNVCYTKLLRALKAVCGINNPGDAAAALVLKRREDAEAAGDPILGTVSPVEWKNRKTEDIGGLFDELYGLAPDAQALVNVALDALLDANSHQLSEGGAVITSYSIHYTKLYDR